MKYSSQLFSWYLTVWTRFGHLNRKKRPFISCVTVAGPTLMCSLVTLNLYSLRHDLDEMIYSYFNIIIIFTGAARAFVILTKQDKFLNLLNDVNEWCLEFERQNDEHTLNKLKQLIKRSQFLSKCCLRFIIPLGTAVAFQPIIMSYGSFVAEFNIPGIDVHKSPLYECLYFLQACWIVPITFCSYVPYSSFMLIFICFGILVVRDLQRKIEDISKMEDKEALESFKKCVAYHVKIIKYRNDFEHLFSFMNLIDVSLYCGTLCGMLVYTTVDYTYASMIKGCLALVLVTVLIFLTYLLADIFTEESSNLARAAYNTDWINNGKEYRRCVLLIIAQSQRPLELTAGDIKPMNMNTFQAIMRTSYSVFSLLQSTM